MASRAPKLPAATVADLLGMAGDDLRRHELIEGSVWERGASSGLHAGVQALVIEAVGPFHRRPGGRWPGGWWIATEADIYFDEQNTLRPDVSGWRRERVSQRPADMPV